MTSSGEPTRSTPSKTPPDSARIAGWIKRARAGDSDALEELLHLTGQRLERSVRARLGPGLRSKIASSDILQSTYLKVVEALPRFEGDTEDDFTAWATRILENTIRNRARYHRAGKRDAHRETSRDVREVNVAAKDKTPSSAIALGEELSRIGRAMQDLAPDYVRVLTLHMDPEQTHRETARLMGRTEGATRVLLARARAALLVALRRADVREGSDGKD